MLGYFALVSLFPRLDTPRHEAAWCAYWHPGVARRVLPGALAALLVCGSVPARATMPTFDFGAYAQRGVEFVKNEWRFMWDKSVSIEKKLRDAALAYSAYVQARAITQRVKDGNITVSLQNALPVVEMESDLGNGQQETLTLRPIFNARQRMKYHFHGPKIRFDVPNLANFDLDVDRNVVTVGDPTNGMSLQQIQQQAVDDGWLSWTLTQQAAKLDQTSTQTPTAEERGYSGVVDQIRSERAAHVTRLAAIARMMLQDYGEGSVQYVQAMDAYAAAQKAMSDGTADQQDQALVARLQALDAEAQSQIDKYAANNQAMLMAVKREANTTTQVNSIAAKYDASGLGRPWGLADFVDIYGQVMKMASTLDAMNAGNKSSAPLSREPLGNQQKSTVLARWTGDNTNEILKLQARKSQEESQAAMKKIAQEKVQVLSDAQAQRDADAAKDALLAAKTKIGQMLAAMEGATLAAMQPVGLTPIIPDAALNAGVGGGAVGSAGADDAITANLKLLTSRTGRQIANDIPQAIQDSGTTLSWGLLRPLAMALDAGARTVLHKSFDLTHWTD